MNYILTDRGIDALKECGLDKVVEENFDELDRFNIGPFMSSEDIRDYALEHRVHPVYKERFLAGDYDNDEFNIFSFKIPNYLAENGKIPKNLSDAFMTALSVDFLTRYYTHSCREQGYSWRNKRFLTHLCSNVHGDFYLGQYDHTSNDSDQTFLFNAEPLVKKLQWEVSNNSLNAHYSFWTEFLQHLLYFCCQTDMEVPFKKDYLEVFYNGRLPDEKPGMVSEMEISHFKFLEEDFKAGKKTLYKDCIPKYPDFLKQEGWNFTGYTTGHREYQAFIMDGNLVYCEKQKEGPIDFAGFGRYSEPKIILTPDMIKEAILGVMSVIFHGGGRNLPQDPGLIMKHFPYFLFENI